MQHNDANFGIGTLARRTILALAAGAAAAPFGAAWGWAQAYPSRPVRVIVPVAAGGANDTTARLFAQKLGELLGQQFYVENLAGAGGNLGIGAAARAASAATSSSTRASMPRSRTTPSGISRP
jgi:tripartite-type tricarboxylate transporter receptor subunit TctC